MADSDGVGLNSEQFTITMSTCTVDSAHVSWADDVNLDTVVA